LHHDGGFGHAKPGAAIRLRNGNAKPARRCQRAIKFVRKAAIAITCEPVLITELRTEGFDGLPDRRLVGGKLEVDQNYSSSTPLAGNSQSGHYWWHGGAGRSKPAAR
jgi:hypothetical protein